ncbi:retrovirus-related pol polyprotein from transposon TNT 1-94 [Tanacetum coccineum]
MLALSPLFPTTYGWPLKDFITENSHQDCNDISIEVETNSYNSLDFPIYDQIKQKTVPGNSIFSGGDINSNIGDPVIPMKVTKKLNHNASERDRRKRVNDLYAYLRSLLPMSSDLKEKLLLPCGIVLRNRNQANRSKGDFIGEQVTNVDDEVDDSPENDLALNVDHIFEADECDAFDSDVNEGPTSQTMFMANLTSEDPIYNEAGPSYDSNNPLEGVQSRLTNKPDMLMNDSVTSELARYKELVGEYEKRAKFELTDRERKIDEQMRIIISDRNRKETSLKSELHSAQILLSSTVDHYKSLTERKHFVGVQTALFKEVKVMEEIFDQMNNEVDQNAVDKQLSNLQESFDNKKSQASPEAPDFRSFFKIKNLEHQIQEKDNVIGHLKDIVTNVKARSSLELEKVKQHYKELFDSIKILRTHTSEKTSTMLNEIESLKAQLRSKAPCFTSDCVKPKVLAPGMYAIDVKPIPHPLKNNRSAHLNYIGHLKESVETVREIVEEARAVKPLDSSLNYACRYTKLSQELLECVIGTCPKNFNERDNKAPSTPVTRKKQVKFSDKPGTSSSNTQKQKVHQRVQLTYIPVLSYTGVNDSTEASGSKPRSITKKNRTLPAKKENKKEVEVRLRTNRSVWKKMNRVDSSISSKRVVINSNSESVNSASNGMCVVNVLNSVNATPTVRIVLHNEKQIWKPKGKLSDNSLNTTKQIWKPKSKLSDNSLSKTQRVWKATGKLFTDIGYQWRPTGKKLTLGKLDCGSQWRPTGKKFALGEMLTKSPPNKNWGTDIPNSPNSNVFKCRSYRFGNDHLGAIMGYGDYVMGDSVISRVYYVEGLGHNLFSVGQFCDSDLEVAFRKHTCFVRDLNGTDILQGSRGTNLYTISIDKMMKSSPICLLSKASKSKSWLWHRRLNHLNFGTINDLARKDLVGLQQNSPISIPPLDNGTEFVTKLSQHTMKVLINLIQKSVRELLKTNGVVKDVISYTGGSSSNYDDILESSHKPDLTFFRVFGALCYPTNDSENLGKFQAKADIGIFVGYAPSRKGYRIYNKRTRRLMETIHVTFDEMAQTMAPVRISSGPVPVIMTSGQLKSGLAPTDKELEMLFQPMFDEHLEQSPVDEQVPSATKVMVIALKWIYKVKLDEYGDVLKNKARLVAKGYRQRKAIDFGRNVCSNGWSKLLFSRTVIFTEEVFVSQPEGFEDGKSYSRLSSEKALYGH